MLSSTVLYTRILILVVLRLTFPVLSIEHNKICYPVGNRDVCFFQPQPDFPYLTEQQAWGVCRGNYGFLPMILDEATQDVFREYMTSLDLQNLDDMWLAGREVRSSDWTWANGVPFNQPDYFNQTQDVESPNRVQGVLDDELIYKNDLPGSLNYYVCQFFGAACQSKGSISLKNGCLLLNNDTALNFYSSRNKCVEKGGDLAIIDGPDDLIKFAEVFKRIRKPAKLWIGLRRQWWIWGLPGLSDEAKYSKWRSDNGFMPDSECMVVDLKNYRWKQLNCSAYKRFVCQKGPTYVRDTTTSKSATESSVSVIGVLFAGISVSVVMTLLVVVVVIAIVKRCKSRSRQPIIESAARETTYQDLEHRCHEKGNIHCNQQYLVMQPQAAKPLLPQTDRPMKSQHTEQNSENFYDDIIEASAPNYLTVTR